MARLRKTTMGITRARTTTDTELKTVVDKVEAVHEYRPNLVSVSYDTGRKRVVLTSTDDSEQSFPVGNVRDKIQA